MLSVTAVVQGFMQGVLTVLRGSGNVVIAEREVSWYRMRVFDRKIDSGDRGDLVFTLTTIP
jgi:hypothetical protein